MFEEILELLKKIEEDENFTGHKMKNGKYFLWTKNVESFQTLCKFKILMSEAFSMTDTVEWEKIMIKLENNDYMVYLFEGVPVIETKKGIITFLIQEEKERLKIAK